MIMKTLRTISLIALAALLFIAVGCEKEEYAEPPVYGKIYCDKEHPVVGDTVKLYVKIDKQGKRINSAEYRWKIRNDAGTPCPPGRTGSRGCSRVRFPVSHGPVPRGYRAPPALTDNNSR